MGQINTGWESDLYNLELIKHFYSYGHGDGFFLAEASGYPGLVDVTSRKSYSSGPRLSSQFFWISSSSWALYKPPQKLRSVSSS